jgi:hypothetical protein
MKEKEKEKQEIERRLAELKRIEKLLETYFKRNLQLKATYSQLKETYH